MDIQGWKATGFLLANGRTVLPPGLRTLPNQFAALSEVTKRGLEIGADGRVFGLVRIHHWCGNDPVVEHIAKVDVSNFLLFLKVGAPVHSVAEGGNSIFEEGGAFREAGWNISEFVAFQGWRN